MTLRYHTGNRLLFGLHIVLIRLLFLYLRINEHKHYLLNNQRDAALSSRLYYSLRNYMFRVPSAPVIRSTLKL